MNVRGSEGATPFETAEASAGRAGTRAVAGLVDGHGRYFSRAAAGGQFVFAASTAVEDDGSFAQAARLEPPYHLSPSARVRAQTGFIYERLESALSELGSSIADVVQIEQFLAGKRYADGYIEASRGPTSGVFERDRPASALVWTGPFDPEDCSVLPTLTAARPEHGAVKEIALPAPGVQNITVMPGLGGAYASEPIYNELVTAGDYAFPVGLVASDWETGVHPDVRIPDWVTHGDAARNETAYNLRILERTLQTIGAKLRNTVHCTIYLVDLGDLYEVDRVWQEWFPEPERRPSRTIVPVPSLLLPRDEKATTHAEGAVRMEWLAQAVKPGSGEPQQVSLGLSYSDVQPDAVLAGSLLWTSGLVAPGPARRGDAGADAQVESIFEDLNRICGEAGTSLDQLLRVRAFVVDPSDSAAVHSALARSVPADPPCLAVAAVPGPLSFPGARVVIDAVAHAPARDAH